MWRAILNAFNATLVLLATALIAFAGWLVATDRIDLARLRAIGEVINCVPGAPAADDIVMPSEQESPENRSTAAQGISSADRLAALHDSLLDEAWASRRLERQATSLRGELLQAQNLLARERAAFEQERDQWRNERDAVAAGEADAAFRHVVSMFEQMPALEAKEQILRIMEAQGASAAARYLAAMQPYQAAEIIRWLDEDEEQFAAQLIEAMQPREEAQQEPGASSG